MKPNICVAVPARTISRLKTLVQEAQDAGADLIEIRLDYLDARDLQKIDMLKKIVDQTSVPLIATNRQQQQGGQQNQQEEKRISILLQCAQLGFQFVDLELTTDKLQFAIKISREHGAKPIVSFHDFERTPALLEMEKIFKAEKNIGAEVCKLVTTAKDITDSIECLLLTKKFSEIAKTVCFAMGEKGVLSRIMSPFFGSYFTYASIKNGLRTAKGQMTIADLKEIYEKLGVNS